MASMTEFTKTKLPKNDSLSKSKPKKVFKIYVMHASGFMHQEKKKIPGFTPLLYNSHCHERDLI